MTINLVERSKYITYWLRERTNRVAIKNDDKSRVVASCFEMVLEHQEAVAILTEYKLYGSAFSVARSAFEGYIRGIWLRDCATEEQLINYLNVSFRVPFLQLIEDVEELEGDPTGILLQIKKSGWDLLNNFTHTESSQITLRITGDYIEPNYTDKDVDGIVSLVNSICLHAGLGIVKMSKENLESMQQEFVQKMKEYAGENPGTNHA